MDSGKGNPGTTPDHNAGLSPGLVSCFRVFSRTSSLVVAVVGVSVLLGWALDVGALKSVLPGLVTMKANTAAAFLLAGVALGLLRRGMGSPTVKRRLGQLCALVVALVGLLTLGEYGFETDFGVDQLLFEEPPAAIATSSPGRMAPTTALNFLLLGAGLLLLDVETRRWQRPAEFLALGAGLVSLQALIGYAYSVVSLYRIGSHTGMALHTSVTFIVLSAGLLCARPKRGLMVLFTSASMGGRLLRWLLPAAIVVPVLLGWLWWQGEELGFYDTHFGIALFTTSLILVLTLLVWRSALSLERTDQERQQAQRELIRAREELKTLNQSLEQKVEERTAALRTEVAERQRAAQTLEASERKFRQLVESSPDGLVGVDARARIALVNAQAEKLFGYPREEMVGQPIEILVPARFREAHIGHRTRYLAAPQSRPMGGSLELRGQRKDGSEFPLEISLSPLETEEGLLVTAVVRDITERKQAEQEIRRLFTLSLDLLCVAGFDGYFKRLNSAWEKTLGFTRAELLEKPYLEFVHPEDRSGTRGEAERLAHGAPVLSFENRYRCRDGSYRWLQWTAYPIPEEQLIYAAARDITESKQSRVRMEQVNAELAARTAELTIANKELEAFTYSVSHDLRAPLRHIDGFSRLLLEEHSQKLPEEARHYLERVREGTRHMGQLVDDLLNLARVTRQEPRRQVTGLHSLVEEVRGELQAEFKGREVEWRIGELPFVECDPALMKQVFANLLSNAVKFTRPRKPAVIEVGSHTENGEPAVFVRDNGVGFSMKYADKLFGVFQRLHRPEDFEGTGVGLATVERIVRKHGGRVWAEAELDKGAAFYFTLGQPGQPEPEAIIAKEARGDS